MNKWLKSFLVLHFAFFIFHSQASELTPYLDKGYAIAPDQSGKRVVVFDATKASTSASPTAIVWEWKATDEGSGIPSDIQGRFGQIDEAKLRDSGNTLLVSSSGAAWAEIDVATKKARRYGTHGNNTHSIEKLPDNTLVLAHSTDHNRLQLVWGEMGALQAKDVYTFYSAHGVEWDVKRNCLWALGYTNLVQLAYNAEAKTLTEQKRWTFNPSGHDMRLGADGKIYFTNWYYVWEFDPDNDTAPKVRFGVSNAKGFHTDATYGDIYQVGSSDYWNDHVTVRPVSGSQFDVYPKGASRMYKVHWATAYPAAYTTYVEMSEPVAKVADDGKSVRIEATVTIPHATATTIEVTLNGTVVTNWVTAASGTYAYEGPLEFGSTNVYSMRAISSLAPEKPCAAAGSFIARAYRNWYRVDFSSDPGYRAGQDWTNLVDVASPGGTWTRQDTNSVFDTARRIVLLENATNLCYHPLTSSPLGEDVEVDFRVKIAAVLEDKTVPEGSVAGFVFAQGTDGNIVPFGYADGDWHELPNGGWASDADWADLRISFDFTSAKPTVSYRLDGVLLSTKDGVSALPFTGTKRQISHLNFTGSGAFGDLAGNYYTIRASEPIPVPKPVIAGNPTLTAGLFQMTLAETQKNVYYCAFTARTLTDEFIAENDSVEGNGASLVLSVTAPADEPSKFARIVASSAPIAKGTKFSEIEK